MKSLREFQIGPVGKLTFSGLFLHIFSEMP